MNVFKKTLIFRMIVGCLISSFISSVISPSFAYAQVLDLPAPGTMVFPTSDYMPVIIKGLKVHPDNPLFFDFILDSGNSGFRAGAAHGLSLQKESAKLIKYFLASLTIKEDDLWVNLSPYEKDRMIADELGQTELGRDMLAQDYILKQLTASLIYPEKELGKAFWARVYAKVREQFGSTAIPLDTFNKVWIVADKAKVLEYNNAAYVVGAHLKVMLETDFKADQESRTPTRGHSALLGDSMQQGSVSPSALPIPQQLNLKATEGNNQLPNASQDLVKNIIREIVLPEIEKEVNHGRNFAPLRQMFYSMILASWYKRSLKEALLNRVYADKAKTGGVLADDPAAKDKIYEQYLLAYKKGVFNYIKEDKNEINKYPIPRKYFSGGFDWAMLKNGPELTHDRSQAGGLFSSNTFVARVRIDKARTAKDLSKPGWKSRFRLVVEPADTAVDFSKIVLKHVLSLYRKNTSHFKSLSLDLKDLDTQSRQFKRIYSNRERVQAAVELSRQEVTRILRVLNILGEPTDIYLQKIVDPNNRAAAEASSVIFAEHDNKIDKITAISAGSVKDIKLLDALPPSSIWRRFLTLYPDLPVKERVKLTLAVRGWLAADDQILSKSDASMAFNQSIDKNAVPGLTAISIAEHVLMMAVKEFRIKEEMAIKLKRQSMPSGIYADWKEVDKVNYKVMGKNLENLSFWHNEVVKRSRILSALGKPSFGFVEKITGHTGLGSPQVAAVEFMQRDHKLESITIEAPDFQGPVILFEEFPPSSVWSGLIRMYPSLPIKELVKLTVAVNGFSVNDDQIIEKLDAKGTDKAALPNGGIDFNAKNMFLDVARDANGVKMMLDPVVATEFQQGDFSGVVAVILQIIPVQDPLSAFGLVTRL